MKQAQISSPSVLGLQLLAARKAAGLSQTAVAKLAGLTQKQIYTIERKPDTCTVTTLFKYLSALNLDLSLQDRVRPNSPTVDW